MTITTTHIRADDDAKLTRRWREFALYVGEADGDRLAIRIDDALMASIVADYNAIVQDEALKSRVSLDDSSSRDGSRR